MCEELCYGSQTLHRLANAPTNKCYRCRRSEGSSNTLERSGWWQRYRLPRCVRVGAAVAGKGIVKGASVVRCASGPVAVSMLHQTAPGLTTVRHTGGAIVECVWHTHLHSEHNGCLARFQQSLSLDRHPASSPVQGIGSE